MPPPARAMASTVAWKELLILMAAADDDKPLDFALGENSREMVVRIVATAAATGDDESCATTRSGGVSL